MKNLQTKITHLSHEQRKKLADRLNERLGAASNKQPDPPAATRDVRLVAYIARRPEADGITAQLQDMLRDKLPTYMVPSTFVLLDTLPLTPNGKVDRQALPEPEQPGERSEFVAPRTDAEAALAEIWAGVLGLDEVGVHDNFFELGGHSLLVTQTISRIRDGFEIELPLRVLFEAPTVAELAVIVEETVIAELETLPEMEIEAPD